MKAILINRAFPDSRVDLRGALPHGEVIGYPSPGGNINQQWTIEPVVGGFNVRSEIANRPIVGVAADGVQAGADGVYNGVVRGGGVRNVFGIDFVPGSGIRIYLPVEAAAPGRPPLYWTLDNRNRSTQVTLRRERTGGVAEGENNKNTQIWDVA